jgi:hypothetical protein
VLQVVDAAVKQVLTSQKKQDKLMAQVRTLLGLQSGFGLRVYGGVRLRLKRGFRLKGLGLIHA